MKAMRYVKSKISSQITMTNNYLSNMKNKMMQNHNKFSERDITYIQKLHELLFLKDIDDNACMFTRIGSKRDGGYVMLEPLSGTSIAYSIGICDNVDWDSQMVDKGYEVFMYDHTIDKLPFEKKGFHWFKIGICGGYWLTTSYKRLMLCLKVMDTLKKRG